jgi:hypothetical protein
MATSPPDQPDPAGRPDPYYGGSSADTPSVRKYSSNKVGARLNEDIAPGVVATSVLIQHGLDEYVLDFMQVIRQPLRVVSRVILPKSVLPKFVKVLGHNLAKDRPGRELLHPDAAEQASAPARPMPPQQEDQAEPNPVQPSCEDQSDPLPQAADDSIRNQQATPQQPSGNAPAAADAPTEVNHAGDIANLYSEYKISDDIATGSYANVVMISRTASLICMDFIARFAPTPSVTARVMMTTPDAMRLLHTLTRACRHSPSYSKPDSCDDEQ